MVARPLIVNASSVALLYPASDTVAIFFKSVHVQLHGLGVFPLTLPLVNANVSILLEGLVIFLDHVPP